MNNRSIQLSQGMAMYIGAVLGSRDVMYRLTCCQDSLSAYNEVG